MGVKRTRDQPMPGPFPAPPPSHGKGPENEVGTRTPIEWVNGIQNPEAECPRSRNKYCGGPPRKRLTETCREDPHASLKAVQNQPITEEYRAFQMTSQSS